MTEPEPLDVRAGLWVLLPQAVSRLSAVFVFVVAAQQLTAVELGALAIATAAASGAYALAPALVGKPLAVLTDPALRRERGGQAQSFAVLLAVAVSGVLALAALPASGLLAVTLLACAIGVPAAMVVETHYWRGVFVEGRRGPGIVLALCYAAQAGAVSIAVATHSDSGVLLSPSVGLACAAVVLLVRDRGVSLGGARAWAGEHRSSWLPYVGGVAAAVLLVQAVPLVLGLTAGLAATSTYRAGELLFGGTNLLIGVASQTLLTHDTARPASVFRKAGAGLVVVAVANGLLLALLPGALLRRLVGETADTLTDVLPAFTAQRAALALATVGSVLLVRVLSASRVGLLGVASAALNFGLLLVGALWAGAAGGLCGLAVAECVVAAYYVRRLRRA